MAANTAELRLVLSTDADVDVGYASTGLGGSGRRIASTVPIRDGEGRVYGALDLDSDGVLVGIEILDVSRRLPGVIESSG